MQAEQRLRPPLSAHSKKPSLIERAFSDIRVSMCQRLENNPQWLTKAYIYNKPAAPETRVQKYSHSWPYRIYLESLLTATMTDIKKTIAVLGATGQQVSVTCFVPTSTVHDTKSTDDID
jgi:hypothetical protein